ncbi:MAG: SixA phosphatase family protein [Acidimicrobiales bacterium]
MRFLTIVRHARAEKPTAEKIDFDRRLSDRGKRQCQQLRAWASAEDELARFGPATALVSAAARTRETYQLAFEGTPLIVDHVFSQRIYNGVRPVSAEDVLVELAATDPVGTSLLVVGHDPTMAELLWSLARELPRAPRDGFPLAGAFVLALPEDRPIGLDTYDVVAKYVPD